MKANLLSAPYYKIKNWGPQLCFGPSECAYGLKCLKEIIPLGC